MKKHKLLSIIIFVLMVLFIAVKSYNEHMDVLKIEETIAFEESKSIAHFAKAFRETYQQIFLEQKIELNDKTMHLLPVFAMGDIIKKFSQSEGEKVAIRTVSDRPRNPANKADATELLAMKTFLEKKENIYFKKLNNENFFFAVPLYLQSHCIKCHGKREDAPPSIRDKYDSAWDYNVGDLRGVMSVTLSKTQIKNSLMNEHRKNVAGSIILALVSFGAFYYSLKILAKKEDEYTQKLEEEIEKKTKDINEKKEELSHRLYFDPNSGLPNRNSLIADLERPSIVLALINIDDFKEINDFYGHEIGDQVLKAYGGFLAGFTSEYFSDNTKPYKLHADEYAIIFENKSTEELTEILKNLIDQTRKYAVACYGNDIDLSVTIGVARGGEKDILSNADMALKKAKKAKKAILFYEESLNIEQEYEKNIEWAKKLKIAIAEEKITPYFQPMINFNREGIHKYEALVRLIDERGQVISPFFFLDIAKKIKLYHYITYKMITKTFEYFRDKDFQFSINLSAIDMTDPETVAFIVAQIDNFPQPKRITFEILESEGIENYSQIVEFIKKVKDKGCKIAIDDFGSGYSNFEHILKLDVDVIKIDGSLIKNIDKDNHSKIIVETIVSFAKKLQIKTCAEFIHSKEVFDVVRELGVDCGQGYFIGQPQNEAQIIDTEKLLEK